MTTDPRPYRGRFAPSPTGALHFGSLVAAVASYLDARTRQGQWLMRMEDLDPPREVPGAADDILRTLEAFGFEWDGPVVYQSQRQEAYRQAAQQLLEQAHAYECACSRREITLAGRMGEEGPIYPGTCRPGLPAGRQPRSLRIRTHAGVIGFHDRIQGPVRQSIEKETGDFVIRRADGLFAYQLAVVVDDAWQGITHIVRGADLILSTPRQLYLQSLLGYPSPGYAHLPVVVDDAGNKLSKQAKSMPVDIRRPLPALRAAFLFLHQAPPEEEPASLDEFWQWALENWDTGRIPGRRTAPFRPGGLKD